MEAFGPVSMAPLSLTEASRAVQAEAVGSSRVQGERFVAADSLFCAASDRVGRVRLVRSEGCYRRGVSAISSAVTHTRLASVDENPTDIPLPVAK
ncbi:hypothetical protein SAMN04487939_11472 [Lysobacter sp. yr284]|nr:hypothetical protein SAMN04487939_11472 [Lysobacter sp. yr284]